ncbi:MAG TPA: branched-chain amino acid ABC transporter permease [Candidatus Binatia bacterium]|jgi:branched-chain amino acid transport system permease protein|nr:branched-chain amino acid ABC transporter permease [Candidatus Binatia bacterium]
MPIQFQIFVEHLLNGLTLGGLYALVTLGLALTFSVIDLVNFAHGDLFMMGSYTLFVLLTLESITLPYWLIILIVIVATALYAVVLERIAIHPIIDRSWRTHAVTTLGISIVLQNAALILFTGDPRQTPTALTATVISPLGIRISAQRIVVLVVTIVVFLGLQWFVRRTKMGKTMRAVSQNPAMCEVVGINVRHMAMITFAIGGAITGLAAALIAPLYSVFPSMGALLTLKALAAIVMGGMGHVNGAIYAAFLLGIVEALFGGYVSFAFKDVISFGLFILVLFVRPHGIFGRRVGL